MSPHKTFFLLCLKTPKDVHEAWKQNCLKLSQTLHLLIQSYLSLCRLQYSCFTTLQAAYLSSTEQRGRYSDYASFWTACGSKTGEGKKHSIFYTRPAWHPPRPLYTGYRVSFLGYSWRNTALTTHIPIEHWGLIWIALHLYLSSMPGIYRVTLTFTLKCDINR